MKKQNKIAIDIVLLLPPEIVERCIFVNSKLDNSNYVSFKNGYNPHITLGMGCMLTKDLELLKSKIQNLLEKIKPLELNIPDYTGKNFFSFGIEKTSELMNLHRSVMRVLEKFASYGDASYEMFNESEKVANDPKLVNWVSSFVTEHAGDNYDPHISLGEGERPQINFPFNFTTNNISIFHIGQRGTCKKLLASYGLK